jgi:glutaminyl-tRNA synthetase
VITWLGAHQGNGAGVPAQVRLYGPLFNEAQPDSAGKDWLDSLNHQSLQTITAYVEPSVATCLPERSFQFERHGYFVSDRQDHGKNGIPVFSSAGELTECNSMGLCKRGFALKAPQTQCAGAPQARGCNFTTA